MMKTLRQEEQKQWLAIYTRSKCEKKVAAQLTEKNIENYCPLNRVVRQWSDRKKVIMEPLFVSYVFVRLTQKQKDHIKIDQLEGAVTLVYWLGKPAVIRDEEIDLIKKFLSENSNVKVTPLQINVDDKVRIVGGPLVEQQGKVIEVKISTVKVTLPSLGYVMSAEVKISNVEVITTKQNGST